MPQEWLDLECERRAEHSRAWSGIRGGGFPSSAWGWNKIWRLSFQCLGLEYEVEAIYPAPGSGIRGGGSSSSSWSWNTRRWLSLKRPEQEYAPRSCAPTNRRSSQVQHLPKVESRLCSKFRPWLPRILGSAPELIARGRH